MDYERSVRAVRALADGEERFLQALGGVTPAEATAFATFLDAHRLLPWLEPVLSREEVRSRLPPALAQAAEEGRAQRHRRADQLVAESLEVEAALAGAGIECLFLKGLYFAQRFHGGVYRRHQRDVDVLIRERDRSRAHQALETLGYEDEPVRIGEGAVRLGMRRGYSAVDLHWNLRRRARRRIDVEQLWEARVPFHLSGRRLSTLSDEHTLLFLLLSMCGDLRRGACTARHLLDLYLVLRAIDGTTDWEAFLSRRARESLAKPCVNVLAVLLAAWRVAPEFPRLSVAVARRARMVEVRDAKDALALVTRPRQAPENQAWFRRAYPYDTASDWARRLTLDLPHTLARMGAPRAFARPAE